MPALPATVEFERLAHEYCHLAATLDADPEYRAARLGDLARRLAACGERRVVCARCGLFGDLALGLCDGCWEADLNAAAGHELRGTR